MAKYTKNDIDVKKMGENERQDFDAFLLNFNVDNYQQINKGIDIVTNKKSKFKNIQTIIDCLFYIPIVICVVLAILYAISMFIYFRTGKSKMNPNTLKYIFSCGLLAIVLTIVVIVVYVLYSFIVDKIKNV